MNAAQAVESHPRAGQAMDLRGRGPLSSNGTPLPSDGAHLGRLRASDDIVGHDAALRERLRDDGYVYLPGLLARDDVLALREAYFAAPGHESSAHGVAGHPAHTFVRTARYREFVQQPALHAMAATLLEAVPELLPRQIVRAYRGGSKRASRAHTDFRYIDEGTDEVLTAWIPIGDCPVEGGALIYLDRSHLLDPATLPSLRAVTDRPDDVRALSHDLGWVSQSLGRPWLAADFEAGDVVFHSPHIVHASLDPVTSGTRLSTDVRFIPAGHRTDPRWREPWSGDDGY